MHAAVRVALRHLLVQDAAAGRHPLHVAGAEAAAVAEAVAVLDVAGEHVGDRLDAAVRMPRKAGEIVARVVVAEVVEEQERIELRGVAEAERALQLDAGAFDGGLRVNDFPNRTNRHDLLLEDVSDRAPAGSIVKWDVRSDAPSPGCDSGSSVFHEVPNRLPSPPFSRVRAEDFQAIFFAKCDLGEMATAVLYALQCELDCFT